MKCCKKAITSILAAAMILFCFTACSEQNNPLIVENPTGELVIYANPIYKYYYLESILPEFESEHPELKLTVRDFGDVQNPETQMQYRQILKSELMAGSGPDLILGYDYDLDDIYKSMDAGAFCDLNPYLKNDKDFKMENYNETVLNAGVYQGKRFLMPLSYSVLMLLTTDEILAEENINPEDLQYYEKILQQIDRYIEKYKNNPGKSVFWHYGLSATSYFPWCGVPIVDYVDKSINVDAPAFKILMERYKNLYPQDMVLNEGRSSSSTFDSAIGLKNQTFLFQRMEYNSLNGLVEDYGALLSNRTPRYFKMPTVDGKTQASVNSFGAIRNNSKNKANAYAFLKYMMSVPVQSSTHELSIPVEKSAVVSKMNEFIRTRNGGLPDGSVVVKDIPTDTVLDYMEQLQTVDYCEFMPWKVLDIVFETMQPYFAGEESYETCLVKTKEQLELYISE